MGNGIFKIPENFELFVDVSSVDLVEGQEYVLFSFAELQGEFARLELIGSSCEEYTAEPIYDRTEVRIRVLTVTSDCFTRAFRNHPRLL